MRIGADVKTFDADYWPAQGLAGVCGVSGQAGGVPHSILQRATGLVAHAGLRVLAAAGGVTVGAVPWTIMAASTARLRANS